MNWRHLTDEGMDDGFKNRVVHLFEVLAQDPSDANVERFKKGLEDAKAAYDKLTAALEL